MVLRFLIFFHRWIGVAVCLIFLVWFPSGIGMMYWTFPEVSPADRLERSPALDPSKIVLTPIEAATKIGVEATPAQTRLNTFDGRPVYRFDEGRGSARIVYADTGEERLDASRELIDRVASAWAGKPALEARAEAVQEVDQWTVAGGLRNLRPMYKYTFDDGQHVYINGRSGEVVQYTTTSSRFFAHISAIPHWMYYTPLRDNQPVWIRFMIYTALIGTITALIGMIVAIWMYSPSRKYRIAGKPTGIPYRGQKRWHTIFGLIFGAATVTWAFSGMLSLGPFPLVERLAGTGPRAARAAENSSEARGARGRSVAGALRGRVEMTEFATVHPADVLRRISHLPVKELEFSSFDGEPVFGANLGNTTQMVSLQGNVIEQFDPQKIADLVKSAAADPSRVETRLVEQYDHYYLDRTRQRPLPVVLALMNDEERTRYYIDPKTARILTTYSSRNWVNRWLTTVSTR
jgi:hypothetical protein